MKKRIKIVLVAATIVALPLMGAGMQQSKSEEKSLLVDFIEYCKTCENLRQVDPNKDYTQATFHELKNAARRLYDLGCLENGELESVTFDVEEKEGE